MAAIDPDVPLVLGVDGGGSRCAAALARAAAGGRLEVIGRGIGGPANPRVAGHETARASIMSAVEAAFATAGATARPVAAACFGLAGVGLATDRDGIIEWATQVPIADRMMVVADGILPFADTAADPWGVVLIAGTGSLALARPQGAPLTAEAEAEAEAEADRCGGWGPLLGDEGSGHAIALAALKAAMRSADGRGPPTIMLEGFLRRFASARAADLVARLHAPGVGRREIADAAREAVVAAELGDPVAVTIMTAAAADLALHVRTLVDRNRFAPGVYPLRFSGGLLTASATLGRLVADSLAATGHEPGTVTVVTDPTMAAARFAAMHAARAAD